MSASSRDGDGRGGVGLEAGVGAGRLVLKRDGLQVDQGQMIGIREIANVSPCALQPRPWMSMRRKAQSQVVVMPV